MKKSFAIVILAAVCALCAQQASAASTSRDEYFYDSRADQPYRSPHNSGSLYSDGGTEERAVHEARRSQNNYRSGARINSSGAYDARSGGSWSVNGKSVFKHDRRSYGRY